MVSLNYNFTIDNYKLIIEKKYTNYFFKNINNWIFNFLLCINKTNINFYHIILNILKFVIFYEMAIPNYKYFLNNKLMEYYAVLIFESNHNNIIRNNFLKIDEKIIYKYIISNNHNTLNYLISIIEKLNDTILCFNKKLFIYLFTSDIDISFHIIYRKSKIRFLMNDTDFIYEVIKINPNKYFKYNYIDNIRYDKDIINLLINKGIKLNNKNFPLEFNDSKEFILNNTKLGYIGSIYYASKRLKTDKEFNIELIKINYKVIKYIKNNKLYKDYAMEINKKAIGYFY
jgi:hypothetical protein